MATENLTTYTEVDTASDITVTTAKVDVTTMGRNVDAYVYKDFGADYFNGLNVNFETYFSSSSDAASQAAYGSFSNVVNDFGAWATRILIIWYNNSGSAVLSFGTTAGGYDFTLSFNTLYYLTLKRVAGSSTITLYIYSDSARTTLVASHAIPITSTDKFRYFYAVCSLNTASAVYHTGYGQNFEFGTPPTTSSGFFRFF